WLGELPPTPQRRDDRRLHPATRAASDATGALGHRRATPYGRLNRKLPTTSGDYTVRSASVGESRAARIAGRRPATAPMMTAAPSPPAHASGGTETDHPRFDA